MSKTKVSVDEGKYTFIIHKNSRIEILRYGDEWIKDWVGHGANALIAMICELEECRNTLKKIEQTMNDFTQSLNQDED